MGRAANALPALRRLRGAFHETRSEFYGGVGGGLLLLFTIVFIGTIWAGVISEFTLPPSTPTHWYLLALFFSAVIVAGAIAPRAGSVVVFDGTSITVSSRFGRVRVRILLSEISEARIVTNVGDADVTNQLVITAGGKRYGVHLCKALADELPVP